MTGPGTGSTSWMIRRPSFLSAREAGTYRRHTFSLMANLQLVAWWTLASTFTTTMQHSAGPKVLGLGLSSISLKWSTQGKGVTISVESCWNISTNCKARPCHTENHAYSHFRTSFNFNNEIIHVLVLVITKYIDTNFHFSLLLHTSA